jgi:biopolymer transport protein ExbD
LPFFDVVLALLLAFALPASVLFVAISLSLSPGQP